MFACSVVPWFFGLVPRIFGVIRVVVVTETIDGADGLDDIAHLQRKTTTTIIIIITKKFRFEIFSYLH